MLVYKLFMHRNRFVRRRKHLLIYSCSAIWCWLVQLSKRQSPVGHYRNYYLDALSSFANQCTSLKIGYMHTDVQMSYRDLIKWMGKNPDSKVHGANMGPIWSRQDPGRPHFWPMNLAIWVISIPLLPWGHQFTFIELTPCCSAALASRELGD